MRNLSIAAIAGTLFFAPGIDAQAPDASLKAIEIVPGLTFFEGEGAFTGGNVILLTGDEAIILIDDGMEPYKDLYLKTFEQYAGRPVDFVINTHVHGDHIGANRELRMSGTNIVAHDNVRRHMLENGLQSSDGMRPAEATELPQITFSDEVTFHLNGYTAHVMHLPHAHTDGDSFMHLGEINVILAGDAFFNGLFPYIDLDNGGTVDGFLAAQKRMLNLADDETRIAPGHGHLATKADLQTAYDMLFEANARIKALVDAGKSEEEIVAENPLADYHDVWNWGFITTERMTRTLYRSNSSK
jgi:glyoxylase-like metal-dependent hydrolase (beta-lactamase superfamily II)